MSVVLTPNNTRSVVKSPVNGDAADASTLTSETTQPMANNLGFTYQGLYGSHQLPTLYSVNGTDIVVGAIPAMRTTTVIISKTTTTTVVAATALGSALANSTWYYLYAYNNAGTLAFSVSTTAPQANLRYKTGDNDSAYCGCFRTNGSAVIIPFQATGGRYVYTLPLNALTVGASPPTSFTDLSLASYVPPHSRLAALQALAFQASSPEFLRVKPKGVTASGLTDPTLLLPVGTHTANIYWRFECPTDGSQVVQYMMDLGGVAAGLSIDVTGFCE